MNYKVLPTPRFKNQVKKLKKKFPLIDDELREFEQNISKNPAQGANLGNKTYRSKIAAKSIGKGNGGARVITYIMKEDFEIYLLTIYDRPEVSTVTDKAVEAMVREVEKIV